MKPFRLGLFVVATLAILAGGIFLIGSKQLSFRSTYRLKTEFENVGGLQEGAEVRVGGMHEGTIKRIDLPTSPDGKVTVVMDLASRTRDVVKSDSTAAIASEGLVGDKYIEVSFGSTGGSAVKDGDTIASQPPIEMSALLKKTDEILDQAREAVTNLNGTSKDIESISNKLNTGKGTVGALINDKGLYEKVTAGASALQEDAEALKHNFLLRGFFKNRGYEDAADLAKHSIRELPSGPHEKDFSFDGGRLFDHPDTAKLKNDKELKTVGQFLENNRTGLVVVAAKSGMKGDADKLNQLTQARAAVIRDYLVKNFRVDDTKIKTMGEGKSEGTPDAGEVTITVYPQPAAAPATGGR